MWNWNIRIIITKAYLIPSLSAAVVTSVYSLADMVAIGRGGGPEKSVLKSRMRTIDTMENRRNLSFMDNARQKNGRVLNGIWLCMI